LFEGWYVAELPEAGTVSHGSAREQPSPRKSFRILNLCSFSTPASCLRFSGSTLLDAISNCRGPAKRSGSKLRLFHALPIQRKECLPQGGKVCLQGTAPPIRTSAQGISAPQDTGIFLWDRVIQAAAPPLRSRARISWPSRFK